jgi:uncharacterized membrane protein
VVSIDLGDPVVILGIVLAVLIGILLSQTPWGRKVFLWIRANRKRFLALLLDTDKVLRYIQQAASDGKLTEEELTHIYQQVDKLATTIEGVKQEIDKKKA